MCDRRPRSFRAPDQASRLLRLERSRCDGCLRLPSRWTPFQPSQENPMAAPRLVTGLFPDRDSAERAYSTVASRGYDRDDVNLVMSDETRQRHFAPDAAVTT